MKTFAAVVLSFAFAVPSLIHAQTVTAPITLINGYHTAWWKDAVVYQVYPRSFNDSNGDGIGDLNGITAKLDYLQQLGINVVWLSPHYDSPNADNGYDIRDYRKVMKEFGTMADFDRLLAGVHKRHMRLIIDLVVNHTSDEHEWFKQSRLSKDNPYRDFYFWRDGKPNPADPSHPLPPNNWPSFFSGSAWTLDPTTNQFYLHLFAAKQPDLNWDNPKVRQEVYSLMRFWLDKGVDGFRMDVIPLISKPTGLPDLPLDQNYVPTLANGPHRDEYLQEMNREVLSKYDDMSVGEALGISLAETPRIVGADRHELSMIFNFDAVRINRGAGYTEKTWSLPELKAIYDDHARTLGKTDWDTVFLSNHDNPRLVSNFGDTSTPELRDRSAKLLETMILTLRGTPFLYQGDELAMTNYPFTKLDEFNDIEVKNAYDAKIKTAHQALVASGKMTEAQFAAELAPQTAQFVAQSARFGRDNARTPMQWSNAPNGGFTTPTATPWLTENPNYKTINAAEELRDPNSVYHYTRRVIALHHANQAFVYGDYVDLDPTHTQVFAYTRTLGSEHFLVVLNMSKTPVTYSLPTPSGRLILANTPTTEANTTTLHLAPWESRIYSY